MVIVLLKQGKQLIRNLYLYEDKPSIYDRFSFSNWQEFKSLFNQEMLSEIWRITLTIQQEHIPIFIGYNTKNQNIHWQVAMIDLKDQFSKIRKEYMNFAIRK